MTLNENGWFNLSRTCHVASSWIIWWITRHIPIHLTGADGVRSCRATKPISSYRRASAFSFDHFSLRYRCLILPISSLNGDGATFSTVEGEITTAPSIFLRTPVNALRSGRQIDTISDRWTMD